MNVGIVMAGGIGSRFKGDTPKQYYKINGKEMIFYTIDAFKKAKSIDEILIVLNESEYELNLKEHKYDVHTVLGGKTRNHSFYNALKYINDNFPNCEKFIENNAACPMIKTEAVDKYMDLLNEYSYVQTAYKITEALCSDKFKDVNRDDFYLIQSPDAYRFKELFSVYDPESNTIHPAQQLPESAKGYSYYDYGTNIKVTYPTDIKLVEFYFNLEKNGIK